MSLLSILGFCIFILLCFAMKPEILKYNVTEEKIVKYVDDNNEIKIVTIPAMPKNWNGIIRTYISFGILLFWILFGTYLMWNIGPKFSW